MAATDVRAQQVLGGPECPAAREIACWVPPLRPVDLDVKVERDVTRARVQEQIAQDPYAQNAVRHRRDLVIGNGWNLTYKPHWKALNVDEEHGRLFADKVKARWKVYAHGQSKLIDVRRMQTFDGLMGTIHDTDFFAGEGLVACDWREDSASAKTCFKVIDTTRLSNPNGHSNNEHLREGIERNEHGEPTAYHIRRAHPGEGALGVYDTHKWDRFPRFTPWGRPVMLHAFRHARPDMSRGQTEFTSIVALLKMLERYRSTELQSAIVQSSYAAVIETELDWAAAMQTIGADQLRKFGGDAANPLTAISMSHMKEMMPWARDMGVEFHGAQIPHLMPNEKLNVVNSTHPNAGFGAFSNEVMKAVAAGLGLDFASLTKNYAEFNYSAARLSLADAYRAAENVRKRLVQEYAQPMFGCWLEEEVRTGKLSLPPGCPGFSEVRDFLTACTFTTRGKEMIDPVKEQRAEEMALNMGVTTLEDLCNQRGLDLEEVIRQRARERELLAEYGLQQDDEHVPGIPNAVQMSQNGQQAQIGGPKSPSGAPGVPPTQEGNGSDGDQGSYAHAMTLLARALNRQTDTMMMGAD